MTHPRVGIGVIIRRGDTVLLGKRKNAHGEGTWCLPGGHLEFGESIFACAAREVTEETGLIAREFLSGPYTNDIFEKEAKHYVTLFVIADGVPGEPRVMEPEKCEEWRWFRWGALPTPLFLPLQNAMNEGLFSHIASAR